jgi:arylformamidase
LPYILSPKIHEALPPLWFENSTYERSNIYKIEPNKLPPVNYDRHTIYSHSVTHVEAESHVVADGKTVDYFFSNPSMLFGPVHVVKLKGNNYKRLNPEKEIFLWEVTKDEIQKALEDTLKGSEFSGKILLTTEFYPQNLFGYHNPDYVLVLSEGAADFLTDFPQFNLYGTSWKSSDFKPGSPERPIHKKILQKAAILECLDLKDVPEGKYFLSALPLRIQGASESPVCPVLFTKEELQL